MNQTITIEINDNSVLELLQSLASLSLIKFKSEMTTNTENITTRLNDIYNKIDSSLEPCFMIAQTEILESEDW